MGNRNIVNGLALIGAIIVIIGVTFAANSALAGEARIGRAPANAVAVDAESRTEKAAEANRDAANEAVDSLAEENLVHSPPSKIRQQTSQTGLGTFQVQVMSKARFRFKTRKSWLLGIDFPRMEVKNDGHFIDAINPLHCCL